MELAEHVHRARAAVDAQLGHGGATRGGDRVDHVGRLPGHRLHRGAHDVRTRGAAREAEQRAARTRVPVGRSEPGERGHEDDTAGVGDALGERSRLRCVGNDPEPVAQPLDRRAGHEDRALERVRGRGSEHPRDRGEQTRRPARDVTPPRFTSTNEPVPYVFLLVPGVKHACPNSAACWSPAMPLTGTRSPAAELGRRHPEAAARRAHLREARRRDVEQREQLGRPRQRVDVEEQRAARVRRFGGMHAARRASGEVPEDPRVDGAERERRRRVRRRPR